MATDVVKAVAAGGVGLVTIYQFPYAAGAGAVMGYLKPGLMQLGSRLVEVTVGAAEIAVKNVPFGAMVFTATGVALTTYCFSDPILTTLGTVCALASGVRLGEEVSSMVEVEKVRLAKEKNLQK
jgi:hypothetical protein